MGGDLRGGKSRVGEHPREEAEDGGWVFLHPSRLPEGWRRRAIPVLLVPLLPPEAEAIFNGKETALRLDPEDEQMAALLARGETVGAIARRLGVPPRSLDRRLAELRERVGAGSTAQLATMLARAGF